MKAKHILEQKDKVIAFQRPEKKLNYKLTTEKELEDNLIKNLVDLGYEYASDIKTVDKLKDNLRIQMEKLNEITFSETEWRKFCNDFLLNKNHTYLEKTELLQKHWANIYNLERDDKSSVNVKIIDKDNLVKNTLQVINQFSVDTKSGHKNRYDVTILVNGLPLCHIELKKPGVDLENAFNQIDRYWNDSFQETDGIFDYVQLFIISNWSITKYYSNTVRENTRKKSTNSRRNKEFHSFKQTSHWADFSNNRIDDLDSFTYTFLRKFTLLSTLTKYCVFNEDKKLLVMRPYQIVAVEEIMYKVAYAINNSEHLGKDLSRGYVWHTTGSGKTLTSFKAAQLISLIEEVDKVVFVVDRMDLDYQTQREYENFQEGATSNASSTRVLDKLFKDKEKRIVVTTIQKLTNLIRDYDNSNGSELRNSKIVFIFDECHRSQFGKMHSDIAKYFKNSMMFGFTGTPIFEKNSNASLNGDKTTTAHLFGNAKPLHIYAIDDALYDDKVLGFKLYWWGRFKESDQVKDPNKKTRSDAIDGKAIFEKPSRIETITEWIWNNFDTFTRRDENYYLTRAHLIKQYGYKDLAKHRSKLSGFNSMLAAPSIEAARAYYSAFKRLQEMLLQKDPDLKKKLNVAIVYNYANKESDVDNANNKDPDEINSYANTNLDDENPDELDPRMSYEDKGFLQKAIEDYNNLFGINLNTEDLKSYYKDVSQKTKDGLIDILIVVNMMLTGFDAPQLNTIWIDKNLKDHGLIQAFSRVNRVFDNTKPYGNVVIFRNIEKAVHDAIKLFSNKKSADSLVLLKGFDAYYYGDETNEGYDAIVEKLQTKFPIQYLSDIGLKEERQEFIKTFNKWLKFNNFLSQFIEFDDEKKILKQQEINDYRSHYLECQRWLAERKEIEDISDDITYEMELIKSQDYNLGHVLDLINTISKKRSKKGSKNKSKSEDEQKLFEEILRAIGSSTGLRTRRELIIAFINSQNYDVSGDIETQFKKFVEKTVDARLEEIAEKYGMYIDKLSDYFKDCREKDELTRYGSEFSRLFKATRPLIAFKGSNSDKYNEIKETREKAFNELNELFIKTNTSN
ncbi:type I restriction endonuclease subunit R [Mycoplasma tullyi]|uniref:Type I restriction enzyme endonuclease subunit n=1 Tax=Mycoplasma tullyi TaxID=1612150 RepID=A0A7D7U333_9MOLU|nr:type I restriction endonuclease subunit R [Mycoplasma tullyi]QMT98310.1 type I restriction endonuclease subunit R [Mycoplasma tullyi]